MKKAKLAVLKSSIHGYGVFTKEPLAKGQFIAELQGSKVHYAPGIYGQSNRYPNWIGIGKDTWIDPVDEFQYLNHSCTPNAGLTGKDTLYMYAMRDIAAGEEITIDYSTTEDDIDYCLETAEEGDSIRPYVGPIQSLSVEVFESYLPYVPDYFKEVYKREVLLKNETP